ncbi:MAG: RNA polymerase-associated protein RapA [Gammaproteobacteria bacterium]|nr:RNA polymerase-associated protein RapA [Gammaproteobacteria bacterium]
MKESRFTLGQRWISDAELEMGLGIVAEVDLRRVTLFFPATQTERIYACDTAPLTRIIFAVGDQIRLASGENATVLCVTQEKGVIRYEIQHAAGKRDAVSELMLDSRVTLNRPGERLFNLQFDAPRAFELRWHCRQQQHRLAHSEVHGLCGARMNLIPHQLYIAHEVARRYAPRVLLADEVGLGKTIEAGLIIHHQLLNGLASRVLIVVPAALQHQWLVEMRRRFHLIFSLMNAERLTEALSDANAENALCPTATENPFDSEQLLLISSDLLSNPKTLQLTLATSWDLLVVDEAHHLEWSATHVSDAYTAVAALSAQIKGVLLLTATPEQLGKEGHFARLRLLDPARFPDYAQFLAEEANYRPIATLVGRLLDNESIDTALRQQLFATTQIDLALQQQLTHIETLTAQERQALINNLLDRHGTGRLLFRNRRLAMSGFPPRRAHLYPLQPEQAITAADLAAQLTPEISFNDRDSWYHHDPRVAWLLQQLRQLRPHKVLLITAHATTAIDLCDHLWRQSGLQPALFHEEQTLIERDRAAAFFAQAEDGTQLLICSEIGSEGRNFQFAHHLILFDIPFNPDLLEQRIGRLDRIGQQQAVEIHLPYLLNSAQAGLIQWYHRAVNAFEAHSPATQRLFGEVAKELEQLICNHSAADYAQQLENLISRSQQRHEQLKQQLQAGRDRLLEANSCRTAEAEQLCQAINRSEEESPLDSHLEALFDHLGVVSEEQHDGSTIIHPGDELRATLPGLTEDGLTFTTRRQLAVSHEAIDFFTWEHPLVISAMDQLLADELGNSAIALCKPPAPLADLPPGTLLLESLFLIEATGDTSLLTHRYLPATSLLLRVDNHGTDRRQLPAESFTPYLKRLPVEIARQVIQHFTPLLKTLITKSEAMAMAAMPDLVQTARNRSTLLLQGEIDRLEALAKQNPHIRHEEINFFRQQLEGVNRALTQPSLRLDALRVIVISDR